MGDEEILKHLKEFLERNPEVRFSLEEYKIRLDLKDRISKLPSKGTKLDLQQVAKEYLEKAVSEKKPMSTFIKSSDFNLEDVKNAQLDFLKELIKSISDSEEDEEKTKSKVQEIEKYAALVDSKPEIFEQIISAALENDVEKLVSLAEKSEVDSLLFYNLGVTLIQPLMEELRNQVVDELGDSWWRRECPICGREAIVGKLRERRRYFLCNFCNTEYHVQRIMCNHCDNQDQHDLAFYTIEELKHLEIDFCKKCSHYIKMIDEDKLKEPIPRGLEDIFTLKLDYIAQQQDLIRDF